MTDATVVKSRAVGLHRVDVVREVDAGAALVDDPLEHDPLAVGMTTGDTCPALFSRTPASRVSRDQLGDVAAVRVHDVERVVPGAVVGRGRRRCDATAVGWDVRRGVPLVGRAAAVGCALDVPAAAIADADAYSCCCRKSCRTRGIAGVHAGWRVHVAVVSLARLSQLRSTWRKGRGGENGRATSVCARLSPGSSFPRRFPFPDWYSLPTRTRVHGL